MSFPGKTTFCNSLKLIPSSWSIPRKRFLTWKKNKTFTQILFKLGQFNNKKIKVEYLNKKSQECEL